MRLTQNHGAESALPEYVEVGVRLYAVQVVHEPEWSHGSARCCIDRANQIINIVSAVPAAQRGELLRRAMGARKGERAAG